MVENSLTTVDLRHDCLTVVGGLRSILRPLAKRDLEVFVGSDDYRFKTKDRKTGPSVMLR